MSYPAFLKKWDKGRLKPIRKSLPLKITVYIALFLILYVALPIFLQVFLKRPHFVSVPLFYLINIILLSYLFRKNSNRTYKLESRIGDVQEELNVISDQNTQELKNNAALQAKIIRYNSLKKVVEEINENLNLDSVATHLVSIAFSLISNDRGVCALYVVDHQTQKLNLFKSRKEDRKLVVKTKEGTILDSWVLRHASPLLIEDIKKDFRFDIERLKAQDTRQFASLVSSPLISDHKFLGILRLDHPDPFFYSQDDLRFLMTICDLGAVALENSELFQETQNLAIHDGLTSLYTKGYFLGSLKEECKRALHQRKVFSLLMLDIDYFKNYNDKFGHTAGDLVLKSLSQTIVESLKDLNPIVSRFGGEEFCVILPGVDKKEAFSAANLLREKIEKKKIILRRHETNITASIGLATFPDDATEEDVLILKADKTMYQAKQEGRNRVCCL